MQQTRARTAQLRSPAVAGVMLLAGLALVVPAGAQTTDPETINQRLYEQLDSGPTTGPDARIETVSGQLYVSRENLDTDVLRAALGRLLDEQKGSAENVALPRARTLNLEIHFNKNSAELSPESREGLDRLAQVIEERPESLHFLLGGHTDQDGDEAINQPLSQARAEAARRYLIEAHSIAPDRIEARGFGASEPLRPVERTADDKRYNRRVDIRPLRGAPADR